VTERAQMTEEILGIVAEVASVDRGAIRADMPLLDKGIGIDSLGMVGLVVRLEERFRDRMGRKRAEDLDLSTVDTIVDFLLE
jgi:acyl carrier protein